MHAREIALAHAMKVRADWLRQVDGWPPEKVTAFTHPPADWLIDAVGQMVDLLIEVDDLLPRISGDDPMAPALADWLRRVRAVLKGAA